MTPGMSDGLHAHVARQRPAWSSVVLGVLVLAAVGSTRWVRLNLSPSVPMGLYRLRALPPRLTPGMLVLLPVPVAVRPWLRGGMPFLKPVAAVEGYEVCVLGGSLWIAGQLYGTVYTEAEGKPLPRLEGCSVVPEGTVFLASPYPGSLDGRYFGMTPRTDLTAGGSPLLIWR